MDEKKTDATDVLLTLREARQLAPGVSKRTWYGWIRDGKLPAHRPEGTKFLLVRQSAITEFFSRRAR